MKFKCWSHQKGFRSPTEQQLVGWEFDGGNQKECDEAILFEGRLYKCPAHLLRARVAQSVGKIALYLENRRQHRL